MFNYIFYSFYSFASKYRKHGFTLAEALIITVMTGACLLPILGTMQNAQVRTESFDHQSKMQQYSRSRLNAEIANAAFDHKSINLDDEYHYIAYFDKDGNEANAKLTEFPKTIVTPEEIASLSSLDLASEWSDGSKEFLGIDETSQHYLRLVHAYRTTVETRENTQLATFNNSPDNSEVNLDSPKALLAIVVKTCLLYSDGQEYDEDDGSLLIKTTVSGDTSTETGTETYTKDTIGQVVPVTLFSFVNLPTVSDEMIWMADALNCCVYGIDPYSRSISSTIKLPLYELIKGKKGKKQKFKINGKVEEIKFDNFRPWHIAVHPSLKLLACATKKHLYLINIDKKSVDYGDYVKVFDFPDQVKDKGGIAFRPDGKYLFVCPERISGNDKLTSFEITYHILSDKLVWDPENAASPEPKVTDKNRSGSIQNDKEIVAVLAANDGYLYVARKEKAYGVARYPMYCSEVENDETWIGDQILSDDNGIDGELSSIDVTPDGRRLAVVAGENLYIYDTSEKKLILSKKVTEISGVTNFKPNKAAFTAVSDSSQSDFSDSKNLYLTLSNKEEDKDCIAILFYMEKTDTGYNLKKLRNIKYKPNKGGKYIVNSPDNSSVVIADKKKTQLYFEKSGISTSDELISGSDESFCKYSDVRDEEKNCSDLASSKRDVLAVVEGSDSKRVQLYDLNTLKKLEDDDFDTTKSITSLSFNSMGSILVGGYAQKENNIEGSNNGHFYYYLKDLQRKDDNGGYRRKLIFDDSMPDMLFAMENSKDGGNDALWNINNNPNDWGNDSGTVYDRRDFSLSVDWNRLDMIGMPKGGVMVLYGKTDGSSMLEWVGRRNWEQDSQKGKYKLFARWTSISGASGSSKTLPYSSFDSCGNTIDSWSGRVFIMKNIELPVDGRVVSLNVKSGTWSPANTSDNNRYIMPLLLELQSDGTSFKIQDVGDPVIFSYDNAEEKTKSIAWKNGGKIQNSKYRLGFYNGRYISSSNLSPNAGAVVFSESRTEYTYLADYYVSGDGLSDTAISPQDIYMMNGILKEYPNAIDDAATRARRYALSFNISIPGEEFPPLGSKKLAVSPDCGTLAILATDSSDVPVINFYDLNNQLYGPETQIEGLLVDYRIPFDSGAWDPNAYNPVKHTYTGHIVTPNYSWPDESVDFFKNVQNNCAFVKRTGESFSWLLKEATTKNDSWKSFNYYPGNYYITTENKNTDEPHSNKEIASKRFFGYFRPSYDVKYMQTFGSEDIRFFHDKNFIGGRTDVLRSNEPFEPAMDFNVKENETTLFQKDEASNVGGMRAQIYISSDLANLVDVATFTEVASLSVPLEGFYKIKDGYGNLFDYMRSEQTFILKNQPTFMCSFTAKTGSTKLNINKTSMTFSRDKAKPVLYISGTTYLWALYYSLIRFSNNIGFSTNLAISTDGQKLVFGDSDKKLRILDISKPNENLFSTNLAVKDFSGAGEYLQQIATISADTPSILATKPYNSFSSSKSGGEFKLMVSDNSFVISANSAVVASGGIYIISSHTKSIGLYNPLADKNHLLTLSGNLKKNANSAAVAAYDDSIYLFGNAGQSGDSLSGRVQSFNVNTNTALSSLIPNNITPEYSDEYQVNMALNSSSGGNFDCSLLSSCFTALNINNVYDAFYNNNYTNCLETITTSWSGNIAYFIYSHPIKVTVNQCRISNYYPATESNSVSGVRKFTLSGSDTGSSWNQVLKVSNSMPVANPTNNPLYTAQAASDACYKKYKVQLDENKSGEPSDTLFGWGLANSTANRAIVNLFQLWRTNVRRLTPPVDTLPNTSDYYHNSTSDSLTWTNPNSGVKAKIQWSSHGTNTGMMDFWVKGKDSVNNNIVTGGETWQTLTSDTSPYVLVTLSRPEALTAVRYSNTSKSANYLQSFCVYASNEGRSPTEVADWTTTGWTQLTFMGGTTSFSGPLAEKTFITAELNNDTKYNKYLFKVTGFNGTHLNLSGFEMFAKPVAGPEQPTQDYMTPLNNDDLTEIKGGYAAACSTPYGLVISGGLPGANATTTALLYWPHAVNKYDGKFYQYGISRSLPNMKVPRAGHALVWHKGKIYAIGGKKANKSYCTGNDFIECLDYNSSMVWQRKIPNYINISDIEDFQKRANFGACSFGDEIFMFDGEDGANNDPSANGRSSCFAWNPESNVFRKINDTKTPGAANSCKLSPCAAVTFGSKIYVFGHDTKDSNKFKILEYTP